ncbi:hypothetical protein I6A60_15455 [Frankia sp. AgB1.9]|uniref:DUF3592 domain-containing protein n=1 Tax=unclassified Frankia TaxID=2632575 RepID=UPI0019336279|nr:MULTISPECIES: DUF3592 domain-containing protein [unclassified Frankia]MBL7492797.1 hypothetical protein [Frankia sp. AgW1.1]MBL7549272.1 hypothetical protein [Frankia sp. AgB1.9]MBL7619260.1 hypothetical protein [Frankia sp. AgB1.8]
MIWVPLVVFGAIVLAFSLLGAMDVGSYRHFLRHGVRTVAVARSRREVVVRRNGIPALDVRRTETVCVYADADGGTHEIIAKRALPIGYQLTVLYLPRTPGYSVEMRGERPPSWLRSYLLVGIGVGAAAALLVAFLYGLGIQW